MGARVLLMVGPGRSGKTSRLAAEYRTALRRHAPGGLLWLTPSFPLAEDVRRRLLDGSLAGCFEPGILTFEHFVRRLLRESPAAPRPVTRLMRRFLLGQLIAEQARVHGSGPEGDRPLFRPPEPMAGHAVPGRKRRQSPPDCEQVFEQAAAGGLAELAPLARSGALVDVAEDRLRHAGPAAGGAEEALDGLCAAYREHLARAGLCDADDMAGLASRAFKRQVPGWIRAVRLVVVDGFHTFTAEQHAILEVLARHVPELRVAIDGEPEPWRLDLFHQPAETLAELRRRHPGAEVEHVRRADAGADNGLAVLEQRLFAPDHPTPGTTSDSAVPFAQLEVLAAAREEGELEAVATRTKRLLVEGDCGQPVAPGQIVVVFRSLAAIERRVADVFGRFGIPFAIQTGSMLAASPALVALRARLRRGELPPSAPEDATLGEWFRVWRELDPQPDPVHDSAWARLKEALAESDKLWRWLGRPAPVLDRCQAAVVLNDLLEHVRLRPEEPAGRVRVMAARDLGGQSVPYVFLAGLSEKSFPAPAAPARREAAAERAYEEMLLFYDVVTRATRRLVLSYPAIDEAGQPLVASPYVDEVEQACGPGRVVRRVVGDLSPISSGEPLSAVDFRVQAVATALEGNIALLAGLARQETRPGLAANLLAALSTIHDRGRPVGFGPYEGLLSDQVERPLRKRFTAGRTYSPTELQSYAVCPFRFFLERVLRLEPPPEPGLATDFLVRGQSLHQVLADFHRRVNAFCGRPTSPAAIAETDYERLLAETLAAAFPSPVREATAEIDRRVIAGWLTEYRAQCARYDAVLAEQGLAPGPAHFEVAFGEPDADGDALSTSRALEFQVGDECVPICGRIDRIDVGTHGGRTFFNVIDYKSGDAGGFTADAALRGTALQLPLYVLAAERVLLAERGATACLAGYWSPASGGFKPRTLVAGRAAPKGVEPDADWEVLREKLTSTVLALVRAMGRGEFPVFSVDEECTGRCEFHTVCRVQQVRWLEKTWEPTGVPS
jgi:RecB family exonuclease